MAKNFGSVTLIGILNIININIIKVILNIIDTYVIFVKKKKLYNQYPSILTNRISHTWHASIKNNGIYS